MADVAASTETNAPKRSRKPLLIGLVLAVICGGAGFYVTWSGMLSPGQSPAADTAQPMPDIAFVPIEPVVVSLPGTDRQTIRFTAQLEVAAAHQAEVATLMPRILDILNGYLRAIDSVRYAEPGALLQIRAQLLRRIQIVTGEGRVRDLLVTEFIVQ
jgi:flagellar FliL protein